MNRRSVLTASAVAATLAFTGIATLADHPAFAQSTDSATATAGAATGAAATTPDPRAEQARTYLERLAGNLGTTPEKLDLALRDTMKELIDDAVAAGDLAANDAERLKQAVDTADLPVLPNFGSSDRGHGRDHDDDRGRGVWSGYDDDSDDWDDDTSDDEEYADRPAGAGAAPAGDSQATPAAPAS